MARADTGRRDVGIAGSVERDGKRSVELGRGSLAIEFRSRPVPGDGGDGAPIHGSALSAGAARPVGAGGAALAAVARVGLEVALAAVARLAVAVAEGLVAAGDAAGAAGADAR